MKILIVTIEGGGNIPPVMNTISRLVDRNHDVYVLTEPCLKDLIESAGGKHISYKSYFTKDDRKQDIMEDWKDRNNGFKNAIFGPAKTTARESSEAIQAYDIDLLIADVLQPAALIAAEAAKIPGVMLFHMPEYLPGKNRPPGGLGLNPGNGAFGKLRDRLLGKVFNMIFDKYLKDLNGIRADYDLKPLDHVSDLFHKADLRLIQTSPSFDIPLDPAPANVRYTGPVIDDPDWVSIWVDPWNGEDERPMVVVSFSTTFQNQKDILQRTINAVGNLPVRGLVTLGLAMEDSEFSLPENVKVIANASHDQLFPHASAVITHAGHGTVMRAIAHGLPLICIPMGRDQGDNAAKVDLHGLGIKLGLKSSEKSISNAVEKVLSDKSFKSQAKEFGSIIRKDAASNNIVEEIETLLVQ